MANKNLSKLWKTEDWLAVWIGFIVIAIGIVAVLTKAFDFSALTFKTWTWGESLTDAQMAKVVPLGQQLASGAFWGKMLRTVLVLGFLFTIGAALTGEKVKKFVPAFLVVFVLSVIVRLISAEFTLNRYLEWAFWALIVGMLISNTVGTPKWLRPAVKTEFYIKTGLVIMGFSVLFSNIAKFGLYGLGIAWIVTPVVILFMWWFGTRVLKMDNKPLVITMASATSVCGTSAAIASGAPADSVPALHFLPMFLHSLVISMVVGYVLIFILQPLYLKMLGVGKKNEEKAQEDGKKLSFLALIIQGIATSIDALSTGFAIADYDVAAAFFASAIIAMVTLLVCIVGVKLGRYFGKKLKSVAVVLGGLILIFIGFKIWFSMGSTLFTELPF